MTEVPAGDRVGDFDGQVVALAPSEAKTAEPQSWTMIDTLTGEQVEVPGPLDLVVAFSAS